MPSLLSAVDAAVHRHRQAMEALYQFRSSFGELTQAGTVEYANLCRECEHALHAYDVAYSAAMQAAQESPE